MIRAPRAAELDAVVALIASQQVLPESRDAMFDEQDSAIATQLGAWERPWFETSRVAEREDRLLGFIGVELDDAQSRVWIHGPAVTDPDWDGTADVLLAALAAGVPAVVEKEAEIAADVGNDRAAAFAQRHGFVAGKVHHLLALAAAEIDLLPGTVVSPLSSGHEDAFSELHELLFPGTYYSSRQLLDQAGRDEAIVLEVLDDGSFAGYAAGRIDEAGDGYLDFVGVAPEHRRRGLGGLLVSASARAFRDRAPITAVRLTVSSENVAALALYETLGFGRQSSAVGYRRPPETPA